MVLSVGFVVLFVLCCVVTGLNGFSGASYCVPLGGCMGIALCVGLVLYVGLQVFVYVSFSVSFAY